MGEETVDRRVRRTKKLLKDCLTRLLAVKRVQDITVRELTDMADLNRGTFYLHYKDVFDLLEQTENELLDQFSQVLHSHKPQEIRTNLSDIFLNVFILIKNNADLVEILLGPNGDIGFVSRMKALVREKCLQDWMEVFRQGNPDYFEASYSFIVSGCMGLVQYWLQNGMKESPQELACMAEQLISHGISILEK